MNKRSESRYKIIEAIKLFVLIIAIIVSILSAFYAFEANEHIKIIEQSTLKVGLLRFTNDSLHIPLMNGYYSRYPAVIMSATYYYPAESESGKPVPITGYELVERDKPSILTLTLPDVKNVSDGIYNISLEIRYVDYAEMKLKSTKLTYKIVFSNHSIIDADLIKVEEKDIRKLSS